MQKLLNRGWVQPELPHSSGRGVGCWMCSTVRMLILFPQKIIERLAPRLFNSAPIRYRGQRAAPSNKHCYATQKPDWLKHEIIRLKAVTPLAGYCDFSRFCYWHDHVYPHQNCNGRTPAEAWCGINPYTRSAKQEYWFEAWDGLLVGYKLRH